MESYKTTSLDDLDKRIREEKQALRARKPIFCKYIFNSTPCIEHGPVRIDGYCEEHYRLQIVAPITHERKIAEEAYNTLYRTERAAIARIDTERRLLGITPILVACHICNEIKLPIAAIRAHEQCCTGPTRKRAVIRLSNGTIKTVAKNSTGGVRASVKHVLTEDDLDES